MYFPTLLFQSRYAHLIRVDCLHPSSFEVNVGCIREFMGNRENTIILLHELFQRNFFLLITN